MEKEKFIRNAKVIHNNKYDYSLVDYVNHKIRVKIICPIHGVFEQAPNNHIQRQGCQICGVISRTNIRKMPLIDFINKANTVHNNKYDYSLVEYKNNRTNIKIICPKHGEFEQVAEVHSKGFGCKKCSGEIKSIKQLSNKETFINKAIAIHNNKYDYSLVEYSGSQINVIIICKEHGEFKQFPNSHLKGRGCPICSLITKGGWTSHKWLIKANKSMYFDSFKIYVIECYNDNERFIKI